MELSAHNIMMIHIIAFASFIAGVVSANYTGYGFIISGLSGFFTTILIRYYTGG